MASKPWTSELADVRTLAFRARASPARPPTQYAPEDSTYVSRRRDEQPAAGRVLDLDAEAREQLVQVVAVLVLLGLSHPAIRNLD